MRELVVPELLFKYKPLITKEDVVRIYDVFHNSRLYFPKISQLNDPLEATGVSMHLAYAGSSFSLLEDRDYIPVQSEKELYRILSFSSDCFSPQMWAYYCANYNGVCLGFSSSNSLSSVQPVNYSDRQEEISEIDPKLSTVLSSALLKKQSGWIAEKEWRFVKKTEACFFAFNPEELVCVILGHEICTRNNQELYNFIHSIIPQNIPIFRTLPGKQSGQINLIENEYEIQHDGLRPNFITSVAQLSHHLQITK